MHGQSTTSQAHNDILHTTTDQENDGSTTVAMSLKGTVVQRCVRR